MLRKTTEKYVTNKTFNKFENRFDSSSRATAKSFADNAEVMEVILTQLKNLNNISTIMLKEIRTIH